MASPNTEALRARSPKREAWHRTVDKDGSIIGHAANGKPDRIYTIGLSGGLERHPERNPQIYGARRVSKKHRLMVRRAYKRDKLDRLSKERNSN